MNARTHSRRASDHWLYLLMTTMATACIASVLVIGLPHRTSQAQCWQDVGNVDPIPRISPPGMCTADRTTTPCGNPTTYGNCTPYTGGTCIQDGQDRDVAFYILYSSGPLGKTCNIGPSGSTGTCTVQEESCGTTVWYTASPDSPQNCSPAMQCDDDTQTWLFCNAIAGSPCPIQDNPNDK